MSVEIPKITVAFGSVAPTQGDIIELGIHLGCTKEVSSFECLLQNFDKKYTVTNPINVGDNCHFDVGRGDNVPLILTGRVEEVEPESTPVENYIRVRGRCWGEKIFRRVVTKTYENKKGEEIVRDLIDYYAGLSHTRTESDLTSDASSGQKDVVVADASIFSVGDLVKIEDDNAWEYNEVSAVDTVTDTLTMVNNLADTYTVTANGKVWIDLIEKTDTTYTLLEYRDTKVFDILKYIAESADKSGVIGFDFRVEWDGKFAFFPKNSKTSPISLSEKIEHSRYSKDIHRVRNKIMVFGAAEKPYPLDVDGQPWSDSLTENLTKPDNYLQHADGRWEPLHPTHETLSIETTIVHTGSKSVKIVSTSYDYYMGITFTFNSDKYVNGNLYPKLCFTLREDEHHNKKITVGLTDKNGNDCWQHIEISAYNEWQSYALGVGEQNQEAWTLGNSEFDWENIKEVRFDFHQLSSQYGVAFIDRMHFAGCRWGATEENSGSQTSYGLRELVEVDEELHSDNECALRGKALLNHLSQPAEFLTIQTTCLDYGTDRLLPGDKIHVTLPNENIDSDFRIISVEYRVSARDQTLEITLELGKEKPLLADYLYGLRSTTITVEKLMRTKAGLTGVAGGGGGGGGGMVEHGNEWHTPDFLPKDGSETADKIIITDGAGHYLQVPKLTTTERDALTPVNGMIIYNTTTNQFERYQADAWGALGGDGADEKVKVSSDDTTNNFLLQKLASGAGITLIEKNPAGNEQVEIKAHREWGWADEQGWKRSIHIPLAYTESWVDQGIVIQHSTGYESYLNHPCCLRLPEILPSYPYLLYYVGDDAKDWKSGRIWLQKSSDGATFTKSGLTNPVVAPGSNGLPASIEGLMFPSVIYDVYETVASKKYKMLVSGWDGSAWKNLLLYGSDYETFTYEKEVPLTAFYGLTSMFRLGNAYFLIYEDTDHDIRLSVSNPGFTAVYNYGKVVTRGGSGEWDEWRVGEASLFWNLGIWYIFYKGITPAPTRILKTGMATTTNPFRTWDKYPLNPVAKGVEVDWCGLVTPSVLMIDDDFVMYIADWSSSSDFDISRFTLV